MPRIGPGSKIQWAGVADVCAPLPPARWLVPSLLLGPGRPAVLAGFGASGKTMLAQSLVLSLASGRDVWGHHTVPRPARVRHVDGEQGYYATAKRYQRLMAGIGLDQRELGDRFEVVSLDPSIRLDEPASEALFRAIGEGVGLVVLDSLRALAPSLDENESPIRGCLDLLTRASEATGATFLVLHHAGKGERADVRHALRGSSSIFDASGLVLVADASSGMPITLDVTKVPAEHDGPKPEADRVTIEDVPIGENPRAGVRVRVVCPEEQSRSIQASTSRRESELQAHVVELLAARPGLSQRQIRDATPAKAIKVDAALVELARLGRVVEQRGSRRARCFRLAEGGTK